MANYDIVILSSVFWDETWRRNHHIAYNLARNNKVLYLEPPVSIFKIKIFLEKILRILNSKIETKDGNKNLYIYPLIVPFPLGRFKIIKYINSKFLLFLVKSFIRSLGFKKSILWIWDFWEAENLVGKLNERIITYDCYDAYEGYPGVSIRTAKEIEKLEKKLVTKSDIVFVVSDKLLKRVSKWKKEIYKIPNGVDLNNYFRISTSNQLIPEDIAFIKRPIIGYMGGNIFDFDNKVDFELIGHLAINKPEWSFIFIGPYNNLCSREDIKNILKLKNVNFLGKKKVEDLPLYISNFDVCIIPWKMSKFSESANPIKLYEYLACGKPIVSTSLPDLLNFEKENPGMLKIANDYREFAFKIEESIKEESYTLKKRRTEIAKQNSWEQRVNDILKIIDNKLEQKKSKQLSKKTVIQVFNSQVQKHGSFEDFMIEFVKAAQKRGIQTTFIFPSIQTQDVKNELESLGAAVYTTKHPWYSFGFISEVTKIVFKENPVTLDFHFCASLNFTFLFFILRLLGKKVIFHYHGEIRPIEELNFILRHFSRLFLLTFFANRVICVSEANKRFLLAHNIKKEIVVVYNGIKIENFTGQSPESNFRRKLGFNNGELIVSSISSLIPRKGIDVLLKAAQKILEQVPNVRFVIVGGGEKEKYQKLAEDLGIKEKVIFTGLMKQYPFDILKASDLYVSASFVESFGLSIAEAQLLGLPVVATKVGGVPEVVEDGRTALLVPAGDSNSLGENIIKLLKNAELRKRFGECGRKNVIEKFDLKEKIEELIPYVS